jgi:hypothetical protein
VLITVCWAGIEVKVMALMISRKSTPRKRTNSEIMFFSEKK